MLRTSPQPIAGALTKAPLTSGSSCRSSLSPPLRGPRWDSRRSVPSFPMGRQAHGGTGGNTASPSAARPPPSRNGHPFSRSWYGHAAHFGRANLPIEYPDCPRAEMGCHGKRKTPRRSAPVSIALLAPPSCTVWLCDARVLLCSFACWVFAELNVLSVVKTWSTTDAVAILARGRHPDVLHALSQDNFPTVHPTFSRLRRVPA